MVHSRRYISAQVPAFQVAGDPVIIETISAVITRTWLRVQAQLDTGIHPKGIKIPDKAMKAFEAPRLHRHQFHGDWNYTIRATPADTPG